MRRATVGALLIATAAACASAHDQEDQVIGFWREAGCEDLCEHLWFEEGGDLTILPPDDGVTSFVVPEGQWRRIGTHYRLSYDWPRGYGRDYKVWATIAGDLIVVGRDAGVSRYVRVPHP